jgi:hypothetical protein
MKKTKQGVLDLNYIKGKPRGIRLEMPPEQTGCAHTKVSIEQGSAFQCTKCRRMWDWEGVEI